LKRSKRRSFREKRSYELVEAGASPGAGSPKKAEDLGWAIKEERSRGKKKRDRRVPPPTTQRVLTRKKKSDSGGREKKRVGLFVKFSILILGGILSERTAKKKKRHSPPQVKLADEEEGPLGKRLSDKRGYHHFIPHKGGKKRPRKKSDYRGKGKKKWTGDWATAMKKRRPGPTRGVSLLLEPLWGKFRGGGNIGVSTEGTGRTGNSPKKKRNSAKKGKELGKGKRK